MKSDQVMLGSIGWWLFNRALDLLSILAGIAAAFVPRGIVATILILLIFTTRFNLAFGSIDEQGLQFRRFFKRYRVGWQDVINARQGRWLAQIRFRLRKRVGFSRSVDIVLDPSERQGRWSLKIVETHLERFRIQSEARSE